jgi:hypothetical protein
VVQQLQGTLRPRPRVFAEPLDRHHAESVDAADRPNDLRQGRHTFWQSSRKPERSIDESNHVGSIVPLNVVLHQGIPRSQSIRSLAGKGNRLRQLVREHPLDAIQGKTDHLYP